MRELPSDVGSEVDVDRESLNAEVEGPVEILVIPKCAAKPRARAEDALRGAEDEPPLDAEPEAEGTIIAGALAAGIVIGGVDGEPWFCQAARGGGVNGLSSIALEARPVIIDSICFVLGLSNVSITVDAAGIGEIG